MRSICRWAVAGSRCEPVDLADGCPACGVVSSRVHAWVVQRVRDIPHAGQLEVVVRKPRLVCAEPACPRRTFTPATEQLPVRARCTTRLKTALLDAVIDSGRAVVGGRRRLRVAWWTVQATVNAAAVLLPEVDDLHVRRLGIDEHRYRRVRWFRDESRWLAAGRAVDVDDRQRRLRSGPGHRRRPRLRRRRRLAG